MEIGLILTAKIVNFVSVTLKLGGRWNKPPDPETINKLLLKKTLKGKLPDAPELRQESWLASYKENQDTAYREGINNLVSQFTLKLKNKVTAMASW